MPKTAKAKKKVSKPKTKVVSKSKSTTAKVISKSPIKISKTYVPKDTEPLTIISAIVIFWVILFAIYRLFQYFKLL